LILGRNNIEIPANNTIKPILILPNAETPNAVISTSKFARIFGG
jgi:hypothetical protein